MTAVTSSGVRNGSRKDRLLMLPCSLPPLPHTDSGIISPSVKSYRHSQPLLPPHSCYVVNMRCLCNQTTVWLIAGRPPEPSSAVPLVSGLPPRVLGGLFLALSPDIVLPWVGTWRHKVSQSYAFSFDGWATWLLHALSSPYSFELVNAESS